MATFICFSQIAGCAEFLQRFKCNRHLPNKEQVARSSRCIADEEQRVARACMQHIQRYAALFISIILAATAVLVNSLFTQVKEPYHTSILTGEGWIMELLSGHPNQIRCELGVSHDVFVALISEL